MMGGGNQPHKEKHKAGSYYNKNNLGPATQSYNQSTSSAPLPRKPDSFDYDDDLDFPDDIFHEDNVIPPPLLPLTTGVTLMLKNPATKEKDDDAFDHMPSPAVTAGSASNASASSSSNSNVSAPVKTLSQEICSSPLGKALFEMENYIYHVKGLSTLTDKSITSQYSYSGYSRHDKFDMIDTDFVKNNTIEEDFIAALMETRAEDATSRGTFVKKLSDIYNSTNYGGRRFPPIMKEICKLFTDNLNPTGDQNKAKETVNFAQALFTATPIPGNTATSVEVSKFVIEGRDSRLTTAILHSIKTLPEKADNQRPFNRREALLNYHMVEIHKAMRNPTLDSYEILHLLHANLLLLKEMRPNYVQEAIGAPQENSKVFDGKVETTLSILESPKQSTNSANLLGISAIISTLCDQLKALTSKQAESAQPSDANLTKKYLDELKNFASSQVVLSSFNGFTKNVVPEDAFSFARGASSVKKMSNT